MGFLASEHGADSDIIQYGQARKRLHDLKGAANSHMSAPVHRHGVDARALEIDLAR